MARRTESLGDVARWMRRRTIDLIVIGLLAIGAGVVGRELISAYRRPAPDAEQQDVAGTLAEDQPLDLAFGSAGFAMSRQLVSGTAEDAEGALANLMRRRVETAEPARAKPDDDEQALVRHLLETTPYEEQPGYWALYGLGEDFGTQVGLRKFSEGTEESHRGWRVVVWGLSFPLGAGRWTVYAVAPSPGTEVARAERGEETVPESAFPTLPAGAERTMRMVDRDRQYLLGFRGQGPVSRWFEQFDEWFEAAGYERRTAELTEGKGLRVYVPLRPEIASRPVRIQVARDGDGVWRGVVMGQGRVK